MKFIAISDDYLENTQNIFTAVSSLDFSIPVEIFSALDLLTHCVGYIMPLRLYKPIITLILGYWFILICASGYRIMSGFLNNLFSVFRRK